MKKNYKLIISLLLLALTIKVNPISATATTYTNINANTKYNAKIDYSGEVDYFRFKPSSDGWYVIETYGSTDTFLTFHQYTGYTLTDDDSGYNLNAKIGFSTHSGADLEFQVTHLRNINN